MAVVIRQAQSSFALGEFSPLLAARSDIAQYRNGAARLLNRRVLSQGGTETRPGTRQFAALHDGPAVMLPYVFDDDQRYILVLTAERLDAWMPDGTFCGTITGAPWTNDHLRRITWVQSGDTLILFNSNWPPRRLQRTSSTSFALDLMPIEYPAFDKFAPGSIAMRPNALSGEVNFELSAPWWTPQHAELLGRWRGKRFVIRQILSPTVMRASWIDGHATNATIDFDIDWEEQAWSPIWGWPGCGSFMEGRLALAATNRQPNQVWVSRSGAYFNFEVGADDAAGLSENIRSGRIVHLVEAERLLIFTDSEVWTLLGAGGVPLTPKSASLRRVGGVGAGPTRPLAYDSATMFMDRSGGTLREVQGDESTGRFTTDAVSLLAAHLIKQPGSSAVLRGNADRPEQTAFFVSNDGKISAFLSVRAEKLAAFTEWEMQGTFKEVCGVGPDLFAIMEREGKWHLLRFDEAAAPLDQSVRTTAAVRTRTFPGFQHLAGRTVGCVSRGHDLGDAVVGADGTITLSPAQFAVSELEAGLRFRQVVRPMPIDADLPDGAGRGLVKRVVRALLQVTRCGQIRVDGHPVLLPFSGDDVVTPPETFTGILEVRLRGVSREAQFDIEVVGAEKATILGLTREVSFNG